MARSIKISILWLLTVCGFASHSICDVLPMFWGKNMAVAATDGNVDQGMIVFMMTLSYLIPACGILCMLWKGRTERWECSASFGTRMPALRDGWDVLPCV